MDRDNIIPSINYKEAIITSVKTKLPHLITGLVVLVMVALLTIILYVRTILPLKSFSDDSSKQSASTRIKKPAYTIHFVQDNESLWDIADAAYHDGNLWVDLAKANGIVEPYTLYKGQRITLFPLSALTKGPAPIVTEAGQISAIQSGKVTEIKSTYTIKAGDTLWSIAEAAYGDGNLWPRIAEANGLTPESLINADNILKIPR